MKVVVYLALMLGEMLRNVPTKSQESVVIVVPDLDIDNVKIYSTCLRRDGIFIGIFFVMPLGIGICLRLE
jgi:hypothetical protein